MSTPDLLQRMEGKRKGEKVTREHRLKKETCLLQRVHLGVVTGRSAGVQLAGPLSSEQDGLPSEGTLL